MKSLKLTSGFLASAFLFAPSSGAEIVERVIAKVNGDIVTLTEFEARQVAAVQQARISREAIPAFLQENNARILQDAIDDLLLFQKAHELGMRLRAEYLDEVIAGIKKDNNMTSEEEFQAQLRREGMTLDGLRRNIERSILRRQVLARELEPKLVISADEIQNEYDARRAEYTRPETVRVQQILLTGDDADARAASIVERARKGEDFAELARAHSQESAAAKGGELGTFARGELAAELDKAVFALSAGEVSDPVSTPNGIRILRAAERNPGGLIPLADVQSQIRERMEQDRWARVYQGYIEELRKTAMIDIKVREVPVQIAPAPTGAVLDVGEGRDDGSNAGLPARPSATDPNAEIVTTPQNQPQRVVPPGRSAEPKPEDKKPDGKPDGTH